MDKIENTFTSEFNPKNFYEPIHNTEIWNKWKKKYRPTNKSGNKIFSSKPMNLLL